MPNGISLEVYTLADPSQAAELVDSVLQLVEDHNPKPMMNGKPIEKTPTAADKFDQHQAEYESRAKYKDRVKQVEEHNSGYPQLKDELDKRHSIPRLPSENNKEKNGTRNSNRSRQKNPRRKERKAKRRDYRSRVNKNKKKDNKTKLRKAFRRAKAKPYNYYMCEKCWCRCDNGYLRRCASLPVSTSSMEKCKSHHTRDTMSNLSHRYPEPSEPSISSYHTVSSWGNEPMD